MSFSIKTKFSSDQQVSVIADAYFKKYKPETEYFYDSNNGGIVRRQIRMNSIKDDNAKFYVKEIENFEDDIKKYIVIKNNILKFDENGDEYIDMAELSKLGNGSLVLSKELQKKIGNKNLKKLKQTK